MKSIKLGGLIESQIKKGSNDYSVDLRRPYKLNRGTMGGHRITIYLNEGTGGPSYLENVR